ncbi:uncharacterized protein [Montipora capricornis]|uniref:uncharacterized protein n=1 Tax=Montipora capricornis TaxID=246305 RepID=UPI0035F103CD
MSPPTLAQSNNRRRSEDWESFASHFTTEFEALKGEVENLRAEVRQLKRTLREAKERKQNDDEPQEGTMEHLIKVVVIQSLLLRA